MAHVFVTVGTTRFDNLIRTVTSDEVLRTLSSRGCREMVLQIGTGEVEPVGGVVNGVTISVFRSKPSIAADISAADLVIGHGGAGTCLETLRARKPLVVVINNGLMDDHQTELAERLGEDGHLFYCTCETLNDTLNNMDITKLKPLPPGNPRAFAERLKWTLGFR